MSAKHPPRGWVPFGVLIDYDGPREFSAETDGGGMPLWERLVCDETNHHFTGLVPGPCRCQCGLLSLDIVEPVVV